MFFHTNSIREFRNFVQSWNSNGIASIMSSVRGGDNKGERQLMITNEEGEFDQDIIAMGNNFKLKYEQLLEAYNRCQCAMVLIKNVATTSKGD